MVPLGGCPGLKAGLGAPSARPALKGGPSGSVLQGGSPQAPSRPFRAGTTGRLRHPDLGDDSPVSAGPRAAVAINLRGH